MTAQMRTAWFDMPLDAPATMAMGALVDAGADQMAVAGILHGLDLGDYLLTFEPGQVSGRAATRAVVIVDQHDHTHDHTQDHSHDHAGHLHTDQAGAPGEHWSYGAIRDLLDGSTELPSRLRDRANRTFRMIAEHEARRHGPGLGETELGETELGETELGVIGIGTVESIIGIIGAVATLEVLDVDRIVCDSFTVGQGRLDPGRAWPIQLDLVTNTARALMMALADDEGPPPLMSDAAEGFGAHDVFDPTTAVHVAHVVVGSSELSPERS